jgi:hypothetical protein
MYCGRADCVLNEEHIIPFSLGGTLILPRASCANCEKITHRFEGVVGREIFGKFRAKHNLPTRRQKERPTHFKVGTIRGTIHVPVAEHPTELFVYKFRPPNALAGFPAEFDTSTHHWVPVPIASTEELNSFKKSHDWDGKVSVRMRPIEYARMLAKIAYSYAVANLGYGSFKSLVVDLILGKTDNISYAVGGDWEIEPPVKDGGHLLSISYLVDVDRKRAWVIVDIRLFASIGSPTYHVVVGEADSAQHLRTMAEKVGNAESIKVTLPIR